MTRTRVAVRPIRSDDRPALEAIQVATLTDPLPDLLDLAADGAIPGLVAVADGVPVGYLLATVADERSYLPELAVAPARQREGVGSRLLAAACDRLSTQGVATVRLTTRSNDDRARTFYEGRGFTAVGRVEEHYADGTDGVVYERALDARNGNS